MLACSWMPGIVCLPNGVWNTSTRPDAVSPTKTILSLKTPPDRQVRLLSALNLRPRLRTGDAPRTICKGGCHRLNDAGAAIVDRASSTVRDARRASCSVLHLASASKRHRPIADPKRLGVHANVTRCRHTRSPSDAAATPRNGRYSSPVLTNGGMRRADRRGSSGEEIVAQSRRRVGQRLERRDDQRALFDQWAQIDTARRARSAGS